MSAQANVSADEIVEEPLKRTGVAKYVQCTNADRQARRGEEEPAHLALRDFCVRVVGNTASIPAHAIPPDGGKPMNWVIAAETGFAYCHEDAPLRQRDSGYVSRQSAIP